MAVHYAPIRGMASRCKAPGPLTASKGEVTCKKCQAIMDRDRRREVDIPEGTNHVAVGDLRSLIRDVLSEVRPLKKPVARKQTPAQLLKRVTDALSTLGFSVKSRERNPGSLKAWMDPVGGKPKSVDYDDEGMYADDSQLSTPRPSPGRAAMKYKKALNAAGLQTSVSGDRYETVLRGQGFDVMIPSESERADMGAHLFIQVFAGKHADLERSGFDTTDLGEGVIKEDVHIKTADGKFYTGTDKMKVEKELVRFGSTYAERQAIMAGTIPIGSAALSALLRAKAVKGPPPRERAPKPYDWEKEDRKRLRARDAARNKFQAAVKKFAANWRGFTLDQPDMEPQDAAPDAAESFFYDYPEWKEWAAAMSDSYQRMDKITMKEIITDYVYDEMVKGSKEV